MRKAHLLFGLASLLTPALLLRAQTVADPLASSSLEEVANAKILVSSVSRKEEDLDKAPAAAYVITREDIGRSSASTIPDLLRTVPGLQVAQISAANWAVSARGFNSAYANKLLVLVDGRTVYSEVYSGVHWDELDLPLDLIERIEIIRGPGAAVWGANAVNGVINIITRPARETQGVSLMAKASQVADKVLVQQGGSLGGSAQYRAFLSYTNRRPLQDATGAAAFGGLTTMRAGGRIDYNKDLAHSFSLLGDIYRGRLRQQIGPFLALSLESGGLEHDSLSGAFVQSAWQWTRPKSSAALHAYCVDSTREELASKVTTRTAEVELVNHSRQNSRLDLVWGGEARYTYDHTSGEAGTQKPTYNNHLLSGFLQADYALKPHVLIGTLGTKLQTGTLTGTQLQPSARLIWLLNGKQFLWGAVSRAVVAPSLQDKAILVPLNFGSVQGLPVVGRLLGNWAFRPEEVVAFEAGYRQHLSRNLSTDVALFVNRNRRIQSLTPGTPALVLAPAPHIVVDELYTNAFSGHTEGVEVSLNWRPSSKVQTHGSYTWAQAQITQKQPAQSLLVDPFATARNTASVDAAWSLSRAVSVSGLIYHVGAVSTPPKVTDATAVYSSASTEHIASFTRLDLSVKAKLGTHLVLQGGGTNLLQARHLEFGSGSSFLIPHYVPRSAFVRAGWSF